MKTRVKMIKSDLRHEWEENQEGFIDAYLNDKDGILEVVVVLDSGTIITCKKSDLRVILKL